jgi:hypothetical protein
MPNSRFLIAARSPSWRCTHIAIDTQPKPTASRPHGPSLPPNKQTASTRRPYLRARAVEIAGRNSDADAYAAALEQAERETAHDLTLGANYSATLNMIGSMHSAHSQRNSTFPERSAHHPVPQQPRSIHGLGRDELRRRSE